MTNAINKEMVNIWIADAIDASPVDCIKTGTPTANQVLPWKGDISNIDKSGGAAQSDQKICFGGDQTIDKPRDALELSFTVSPTMESYSRWMELFLVEDSSVAGVFTTRQLPADRTVFIELYDGTTYETHMFNNVNITTNDETWNSEDGYSLSLSMMLPPNSADVGNYVWAEKAVTAMPEWSALDGN